MNLFRTDRLRRSTLQLALLPLFSAAPLLAQAGGTLNFGDGESLSIGLGMRSSFTSTTDAAPNGSDRSANFSLDSMRLYMGASMNDNIKAVFNTERDSSGKIYVLDAFADFEIDPAFNIWAGRLLPPSDRYNLDGPYYQAAFDYPGVVSNFYSLETGRDDGVSFWGKLADKKVVYALAMTQGRGHSGGASDSQLANQKASLLYSGRLSVNVLNPEPTPAYLEGSTFFGGAGDIFTVAVAGMSQSDGVGTAANRSDYKVYDIDFLWELPIAGGSAFDLSGAYYKYDYALGAYDAEAALVGSPAGIVPPGKAYALETEYLIGQKVGIGKFQPFLRYQKYDYDAGGSTKYTEAGVQYIIKGDDAKLAAFYAHDDESGTGKPSTNTIKLALQLQF